MQEAHSILLHCEQRLMLLADARDRELQKPLAERRVPFIYFLDKELAVYSFGRSIIQRLRDCGELRSM